LCPPLVRGRELQSILDDVDVARLAVGAGGAGRSAVAGIAVVGRATPNAMKPYVRSAMGVSWTLPTAFCHRIDREAPMRRLATGALVAAGLALAAASPAMADDDGWRGHHRHHWRNHSGYFYYNSRGYYPGYYYAQPYYYYYQPPVYYPAPVYSAPPPPPVYYYPAPVYQGPQFTLVLPFKID
jgi:hypothetical protein